MRQIVDKPSPITGGLLELCKEPATVTYRGDTISYERSFYHCVDSDMDFTDDELDNANLKLIYDTYRFRHGIPTAEKLKIMRERYGIPSSAMSIILGIGENQYGLYEDGVVPTLSVGKLLALAADPGIMREMLRYARTSFSDKLYNKYYNAIMSSLQPSMYDIEDFCVIDYCIITSFQPVSLVNCNRIPSTRKGSYNDYAHVSAY